MFFALWPDPAVRDALAQRARRLHRLLRGRRTRDDRIHLTLAFVGAVAPERLDQLQAPPTLAVAPFTLTLDQWGCWLRNGIGWVAPSQVPQALRRLAANLEAWLRDAGFSLEERGFSPHVTLVRQAHCAPLPDAMAPVAWWVEEFVLVHSRLEPGSSSYQIIGRWPLA